MLKSVKPMSSALRSAYVLVAAALLLLSFGLFAPAWAQTRGSEVTDLKASLSCQQIPMGSIITYTCQVTGGQDYLPLSAKKVGEQLAASCVVVLASSAAGQANEQVAPPTEGSSSALNVQPSDCQIIDSQLVELPPTAQGRCWQYVINFVVWRPGNLAILPMEFAGRPSPVLRFTVKAANPEPKDQLAAASRPYAPSFSWKSSAVIWGTALAMLGICWLGWRWVRGWKMFRPKTLRGSALALAELNKLRAQRSGMAVEQYLVRLDVVIRQFLAEHFQLGSSNLTTVQLRQALDKAVAGAEVWGMSKAVEAVTGADTVKAQLVDTVKSEAPSQAQQLCEVLEQLDQAKFGGVAIEQQQLFSLQEQTRQIVLHCSQVGGAQ